MSNTVKMPIAECPVCLYEMDAATAIEREKATPAPGDFSLCINCGALLCYEERGQLRQATDDDMEHLWPDQKVRIAQAEIRKMKKEKGNHDRR